MATPPSDRASAGAQPLKAPAAVRAPGATQGMDAQILRAGELSGGLLLLLLLLIGSYAATVRRRRRRRPTVAAEWTHRPAQSRYPQASGADADRMLEVFAAPSAIPALQSGRHGALPAGVSGAADGLFPAVPGRQGATGPGGQLMPDRPIAQAGAVSAGGTGDGARWQSHGPASRAVSRRPAVSGTPPWEPASVPDTELPWTAAAAPGGTAPELSRATQARAVARPGRRRHRRRPGRRQRFTRLVSSFSRRPDWLRSRRSTRRVRQTRAALTARQAGMRPAAPVSPAGTGLTVPVSSTARARPAGSARPQVLVPPPGPDGPPGLLRRS